MRFALVLLEDKRMLLIHSLGSWFNRPSSRRTHRLASVRFRPRCEELETRQLLTIYLVGVTDPNATWHSIDEVNSFASATGFVPGDQILFQSGQTFGGSLGWNSPDQVLNMGRPDAPITIGSYDPSNPTNPLPAPATIASGAGVGIQIINAAGVHITDLNVLGGWSPETGARNNSDGIVFDGNLGTGVVLPYVHIDHVTVSGYGADTFDFNRGNGILFGNVNGIAVAYDDVTVTDSVIHQTVSNGIYGRASITHLLIDHIKIYDIYGLRNVNSGYGIHMWNLQGAVIQRSEVFNTGLWGGNPDPGGPDGPGGPVGFDVSNSSHVLFQYNDAHHNHDHAGGDGDGFDFDEHTTDSIMQYNYSHDNDGVGYMLGTWLSNGFNDRNVLRYNVSENDCRYWNYGAILVETDLVRNSDIYNNTVYLSPNARHGSNILSAIEIPMAGQSIRVRNNVFQTSGGVPTVDVLSTVGSGVLFQGNNYFARDWVPSNSQPLILWGSVHYANLDQWRTATRQEYLSGVPLGTQGNPLLVNPGVSGGIDNPADPNYVLNHIDQLGGLLANYYGSTSPLTGVDLTRLGNLQWDPFNFESQGGYVTAYWVATQDFAGHTFTWGGDTDPHTPGAFQFRWGVQLMQFGIVAPATAASGTPFSITVQALDQYGNVNAGYSGTIHFTTTDADGGVVLPGDYTFTADDAGQHTFDGVTLVTLGDQLITAINLTTGDIGTTTVTVRNGNAPPGGAGRRQAIAHLTLAPAGAFLLAGSAGQPSAEAGKTASLTMAADVVPESAAVLMASPVQPLPLRLVGKTTPSGPDALAVADVVHFFSALQKDDESLNTWLVVRSP